MMEALLQNSFIVVPKGVTISHKHKKCCSKYKKKRLVHCQSGSNVTKKDNMASVLSERSKLNSTNGAAIIDAGNSLVLSPNGKNSSDLAVKDLVPCNGSQSATSAEGLEGIGIVKFLRGKSFFVTGATGFLAKVLIEKLLRTVPDVEKIYVLIKAKNRETAITRLKNEILSTEIFKCIQQIHGKSYEEFMLSKLIPVAGNICESNLGLDENATSMIVEDVDVIVNSAANTNFHERARKYGWQDTYVFTKAMGEMLLDSMRGDVPVVILRPSVIESTSRDPFPGWIEGNRMMDPIVTYYGKGQLSGFPVDPSTVIDVVPADIVVNATLAAIAKHGQTGKPKISVYQVASSVVNPLVYKELEGDLASHQFLHALI